MSDASIAEEPELASTGRIAREIAAAVCPRAVRAVCDAREQLGCGPLPLDEEVYDEGEARRSCVELLSPSCESWAQAHYGYDPDVLVLDDAAVDGCVDAIARNARLGLDGDAVSIGCGDLAIVDAHPGEACPMIASCIDGDCIDGRCVSAGGDGQACVRSACAPGLACSEGTCVPTTPRGAPCDGPCAEPGDRCDDSGRCAPPADGDECVWDEDCAVGSRCSFGRCARAGDACSHVECGHGRECVGLSSARCERVAPGAPCGQVGDCEAGLDCLDGACVTQAWVEHGPVGEGGECDDFGYPTTHCQEGLACVWRVVDGVCRPDLCLAELPYFQPPEDCH